MVTKNWYLGPFQTSTFLTYQKMYQAMESNPKVYVSEGSEGLERVNPQYHSTFLTANTLKCLR